MDRDADGRQGRGRRRSPLFPGLHDHAARTRSQVPTGSINGLEQVALVTVGRIMLLQPDVTSDVVPDVALVLAPKETVTDVTTPRAFLLNAAHLALGQVLLVPLLLLLLHRDGGRRRRRGSTRAVRV